jgi:hypothetical protein
MERARICDALRVLTLCVLSLGPGCRTSDQPATDAKVQAEIKPNPPQVGAAPVAITLTDSAGKPLTGASLEVEGNMNHAGMKPEFATLQETSPGRYEGTLEFTMAGDWFLLVTGRLADGSPVNQKVDVPGVTRP